MFPEIVSLVLYVVKMLSMKVFDLGLKQKGVVICGTREDEYTKWSLLNLFSSIHKYM